jgi:hypothetical protein
MALTGKRNAESQLKTAHLFPKQTQDVDRHIVEVCDAIMPLTLDGHPDAVHACPSLEDPRVRLATWWGG